MQFLFRDAADEDYVWRASQWRPSTSFLHLRAKWARTSRCWVRCMDLLHVMQTSHFACPETRALHSAVFLNSPSFERTQTESWSSSAQSQLLGTGYYCNGCQPQERTYSPEQNLGKPLQVNKVRGFRYVNLLSSWMAAVKVGMDRMQGGGKMKMVRQLCKGVVAEFLGIVVKNWSVWPVNLQYHPVPSRFPNLLDLRVYHF